MKKSLPAILLLLLGFTLNAQIQPPAGMGNNIILWLSPDSAVFEAQNDPAEIGDIITEWHDISGGGYVFTSNSGNEPSFIVDQNRNMLDFGGSHFLENTAIASTINGLTEFSIYAVIKSDVTNTDRGFLDSEDPDGQDEIICMRYDQNGANTGRSNLIKCGMQGNTANNQVESQSNTQTTNLQVLTLTWKQGEPINLYIDGALNETSNNSIGTVMNGVQKILIGRGPKDTGGPANSGWDGSFGTLIFYDVKMPDDSVSLISGDLKAINSVQTGNWDDPNTWDCNCNPPDNAFVKINNNHIVTLTQNEIVNNVIITSQGILDLSSNNFRLTLNRNFTNHGTLIAREGELIFSGVNEQLINGSGATNFHDLTINNGNGVTTTNGSLTIQGTLDIQTGCFETDGRFTLLSNANGTARIAEISSGACLTGDITMQRYIDAGATDWRFITSAINGATLADLNDDFITSGFPGSDFPLWPSASNPWPSIYYYDESQPGLQDSGFVAATNITNNIGQGQGLWVYCGDTIIGTQPFTIDITGLANTGTINLPVSYTNTGLPTDDGWSMVGNPYPSTLDWDSPNITKAGINGAIYIWNPDLQQFGSYISGIGTNGASNNIASSQAFWVQANSVSPVLSVTESSKTAVDGSFLKPSSNSVFKIKAANNYGSDEIALKFENNASVNFDANYDAEKMSSVNTSVPRLVSIIGNTEYSINQFPAQELSVLVKITADLSGLAQINFENTAGFGNLTCLKFEDTFTGITYDLATSNGFTAYLYDTTTIARFVLHIGAPVNITSTGISCYGNTDGEITFDKQTTNPFDIIWKDVNSTVLQSNTSILSDSLNGLSAGDYYIETTDGLCGSRIDTVSIQEPAQITSYFTVANDTIELGTSLTPTNQSTNAVSFYWDFADGNNSSVVNPSHTYAQVGDYLISLKSSQSTNCFETYTKLITVKQIALGISEEDLENNSLFFRNNALMVRLTSADYQSIRVNNVIGQEVYSNIITSPSFSVDFSRFSKGMYIVTLILDDNSSESFKIPFK